MKFSYELNLRDDGTPFRRPIILRMESGLTDIETYIETDDAQALADLMTRAIDETTKAEAKSGLPSSKG